MVGVLIRVFQSQVSAFILVAHATTIYARFHWLLVSVVTE